MQRSWRLFFLVLCVALHGACATESVTLSPNLISPPSPLGAGAEVRVASAAEGIPDPIGHPTVTVFAIPAGDVRLEQGPERVMESVSKALEFAGYRPVAASERPGAPVLVCRVTQMEFKNYTWFMPMIHTWGDIALSLSLVDEAGQPRWQRDYTGNYDGNGFDEPFGKAVNTAFGKILVRATEDFASTEFRAACCEAAPR
jgi:hypothetical protein